jgi:hypothetical protein
VPYLKRREQSGCEALLDREIIDDWPERLSDNALFVCFICREALGLRIILLWRGREPKPVPWFCLEDALRLTGVGSVALIHDE